MICSRALRALASIVICAAGVDAPHAATLSFVNGGITTLALDNTCSNMQEVLESAYDGFSLRGGKWPAVGEIWYAHVLVSHPGHECFSAGNANGVEILLPANTTFAISGDYPVFCALYSPYDATTTVYYRQDQGCPQFPDQGVEGYAFWAYSGQTAYPWTMVPGAYLELLIPLRSSTALYGQNLGFRISPAVGVWGYANVGVAVGDGDAVFRDDMDGITLFPDLCKDNFTTCVVAP